MSSIPHCLLSLRFDQLILCRDDLVFGKDKLVCNSEEPVFVGDDLSLEASSRFLAETSYTASFSAWSRANDAWNSAFSSRVSTATL